MDENGEYIEEWEVKYLFMVQNAKLMCLIRHEKFAVLK